MVNNNPAGRNVPFIAVRILQRHVTWNRIYELDRLNFDIWDVQKAPDVRVRRRVVGVNPRGIPAIALNTPAETTFDQNIRLCPVLTAAETGELTRSRRVVLLQNRYRRDLATSVTIADLTNEGILRRLPEFVIQLGFPR